MENNKSHTVETQMLIRKPASEVFQAFIDPEVTKNFWFTKSNSILETGKVITWEWEMYGASANVIVKELVQSQKIVIVWGNPSTTVEFHFKSLSANTTYVTIINYGFELEGDALIDAIKDATGGFTTVLDGLKAYLEHGVKLNLIEDKFRDNIRDSDTK